MKPFLIFAGLMAIAGSASGGGQAMPSGRAVPTPTRNVTIFTGLENAWLDAVQKKDNEALNRIVADNFELRSAAAPGVPTAREEALGQWQQLAPFESTIGQMAVHEFGDVMLVSFLWKIAAAKNPSLPQAVFVVDTWKRVDANWQVVVRYAAPVDETAASVPGAAAPSAQSLRKKI
ncbi:MAG: nuclear transport factor 2 family protein [Massilia sp.]